MKKLSIRLWPIFLISFLTLSIPSHALGLHLHYHLTLSGDASNRPHMTLDVSNISSDSLNLVVNMPMVDDYGNIYPDLITMIQSISATDPQGHNLQIQSSQKSITSPNWYLSCYNYSIYYDVLTVPTNGNTQITIQYDIASNTEIWTGLGADVSTNPRDCEDFWAGYLEFILYRPENHQQVEDAKLKITLPSEWTYATVYPSTGDTVNLGTLHYMYGDNVRWKNYQRGNIIVYKEGPFKLASRTIYGIKVMDVYTTVFEDERCHDANFQYFQYLCDHIGILPVNAVLTFYPFIDGSKIPYLRVYQAGPYGWCHGLMGEYWGAGGDIGIGPGAELPQVQLWDFNSFDDQKSYSFPPHGLVRYWIFHFVQLDSWREDWFKGGFCTYYENMAVGSKYGFDQIRNRRFRPMYEYYIENIAGPPEVDETNFTNHSFVKYFKAALTAYYINELLIEHSGGTKTIDDLMKILFNNALNGQALSKQSFLDALNSLTNYDFTDIVKNYLYGTEKLDLDKYLPPETTLTEYPLIIYPNPRYLDKEQTIIFSNLPLTSNVEIYIYDLGGNLIRILGESDTNIEGGIKRATWDCRNDNGEIVTRGTYIYFIPSATEKKTGKIAIIK